MGSDASVVLVVLLFVGYCLLLGAIGRALGEPKGAAMLGIVLGILFGPLGLLVTLLLPYPPQNRGRRHDDYDDDYDAPPPSHRRPPVVHKHSRQGRELQ